MQKSSVMTAQRITFLGFVLDSVLMTITLTDDKRAKVKAYFTARQHKYKITINELPQLVGTLVSYTCTPAYLGCSLGNFIIGS